jgi:hypothetical protein
MSRREPLRDAIHPKSRAGKPLYAVAKWPQTLKLARGYPLKKLGISARVAATVLIEKSVIRSITEAGAHGSEILL